MSSVRAAVALGSNLGDRRRHMDEAVAALGELTGTRVAARSRWIETAPVGGPPQGAFLNGAVLLRTRLDPLELLDALIDIEARAGRVRTVPDGPRTLDLDLLFHGAVVRDDARLRLPHPRLHERAFVLTPLCEIAPDWRHPVRGLTAREMLSGLARARTAGHR